MIYFVDFGLHPPVAFSSYFIEMSDMLWHPFMQRFFPGNNLYSWERSDVEAEVQTRHHNTKPPRLLERVWEKD